MSHHRSCILSHRACGWQQTAGAQICNISKTFYNSGCARREGHCPDSDYLKHTHMHPYSSLLLLGDPVHEVCCWILAGQHPNHASRSNVACCQSRGKSSGISHYVRFHHLLLHEHVLDRPRSHRRRFMHRVETISKPRA